MKSTIFIPKKCKVGFNKRQDTYTGKLGYVIYNDGKIWRKKTSWMNWIENYISTEEFEAEKAKAYERDIENQLAYALRNNGKSWKYFGNGGEVKDIATREDVIEKVVGTIEQYPFSITKRSNDPSIVPFEFENIPMEGFVLNRKAGGGSSGWNARQTYCRVYDPRGFEVELTIPNLLYILENATSIKGKGLEGKFVYGWEGKDLVLIPESAPEYDDLVAFTELQALNVKKPELILGGIYLDAQNNKVTYLGDGFKRYYDGTFSATKLIWFFSKRERYGKTYDSFDTKDIKSIKKYTGEIDPDFANLVDRLEKTKEYRKLKPEYVVIKNPVEVLETAFKNDNYYECFIKENGKIVPFQIEKRPDAVYWDKTTKIVYKCYKLGGGYNKFDTVEKLTNNFELWQLKMTK
jgi:hypothetical protein